MAACDLMAMEFAKTPQVVDVDSLYKDADEKVTLLSVLSLERRRVLVSEKNDFKLDVVSIRLVKEAPIYSEQSFDKPEEVAAVMGDCMCQFDREVVCVVNLSSDLKPINVHFASVGSLNEAMAHPRELFKPETKELAR